MNSKKIFVKNLDAETLKDFNKCANFDFVEKSALMPDAHKGFVAPIGSVFLTKEKIVPSWVGFDIGCGVLAIKINHEKDFFNIISRNKKEIFEKVKKEIPMGKSKYNKIENIDIKTKKEFKKIIKKLEYKNPPKTLFKKIQNKGLPQLGTLGSGNHFIELCFDEKKNIWIIIHSGSRGIGKIIATYFMKIASKETQDYLNTNWLDSKSLDGKNYLDFIDFCLDFAFLNRIKMADRIYEILKEYQNDITYEIWANKTHNHILSENGFFVHRKGATPAKLNEKGIIPANMSEGSFLIEGLGNNDFLQSSSHGAGRLLSRTQAKINLKLKDFENSMENIIADVSFKTIDESPKAYKNIYEVLKLQKKNIRILKHLKPIINWKG